MVKCPLRKLRFRLNNQKSTYLKLLKKKHVMRCIKALSMDVFKPLHDLNPNFMKEMFNTKELTYTLRDSNIVFRVQILVYKKHVW